MDASIYCAYPLCLLGRVVVRIYYPNNLSNSPLCLLIPKHEQLKLVRW